MQRLVKTYLVSHFFCSDIWHSCHAETAGGTRDPRYLPLVSLTKSSCVAEETLCSTQFKNEFECLRSIWVDWIHVVTLQIWLSVFSVNLVILPSISKNIDFFFKVKIDLNVQATTSPKHAFMQEKRQTAVLGQGLVLCGVFSLIAKG